MKKINCIACGEEIIDKDTIGINKKLIGEDIKTFYCINCLADYLGCDVQDIFDKIEEFKEEENLLRISAVILVERAGQKKMVIGAGGSRIKRIGTDARIDMEKLFDSKVFLNLFVKVKAGWADDERALKSLGYADFEDK